MTQVVRVAFDDQIFEAQARGGYSKLLVELIKRLPNVNIEPVVLPRTTRNLHLAESGLAVAESPRKGISAKAAWASWRLVGYPRSQPRVLPAADVMHHTFTHPSYLRTWSGPRLFTLVDMTPELFPEMFPLGNPHLAKRRYAERSDAIVSISQQTAIDMERFYGADLAKKVSVAHLGIGEEFLHPIATTPLVLPDRYVLFVGVRGGYKDFRTAVAAVGEAVRDAPDVGFVIAGGGALTPAETTLLAEQGLADRAVHVSPPDAQMPQLFRRASAFLFSSRYEGFGMPTLEALASGTPTILADASCAREVGGDVAVYVAPGDARGFAAALRTILANGTPDAWREAAAEHAAQFTWDAMAKRYAEVYRELADSAR